MTYNLKGAIVIYVKYYFNAVYSSPTPTLPKHRTVRNEVSPSFLAAGFASAIHSARIAIGSSIPMNSPVHPHMLLQAAATAAGASVPNPGQIGLSDCLKNYFFSPKEQTV